MYIPEQGPLLSLTRAKEYQSSYCLVYILCFSGSGLSEQGVKGLPWHPQILTDQLTQFQTWVQITPTTLTLFQLGRGNLYHRNSISRDTA